MSFDKAFSNVSTTTELVFAAEQLYELSLGFIITRGFQIVDTAWMMIRRRKGAVPGDIC